jgi:Rhs element Vgr protein
MSTPLSGRIDLVSVSIKVAGSAIPDSCEVSAVRVTSEINRIPQARVTLIDGHATTGEFAWSESSLFVPGAEIEILAGYHSQYVSLFKGIVVRHGLRIRDGRANLVVNCADKALKMTVARRNNVYVDQTDSAVMESLISANGLSADVQSTPGVRKSLVRYFASDWDFMMTRAEACGMVVMVENGAVRVAAPSFSDDAGVTVNFGDALQEFDAEIDARSQLASVTCRAWDPNVQAMVEGQSSEPALNAQGNLSGAKLAGTLGVSGYDWQSAATLADGELSSWASAQLLKSRMGALRGTVSMPGDAKVKLGRLIELGGVGARFNGAAYVSGVVHRIEQGDWTTEARFGMSPRPFVAEQADIEAPPAAGLAPGVQGLLTGKVVKIDEDPDGQTRVQVHVPLVKMDGDGVWARLANGYASSGAGMFFMPEIGDEVVLGFLNSDPAYPVILGSLYSGAHMPPRTPDAQNTTKAIVSRSQVTIQIDEEKKQISISTPGGHVVTLDDDSKTVTVIDSSGNSLKMSSDGVSLTSPGNITIKADGSMTLDAQAGVTVKSTASVTLDAPQIAAKASMSFVAQGQVSAELTASGQVTVRGALVSIN